MRRPQRLIGFLLGCATVLAISTHVEARDYFFSAAGQDASGDGSFSRPWQTISKLNALDLDPGDTVFFHRGDTFLGPILLDAADSATDLDGRLTGQPIRFRAFGVGPLPIIAAPFSHGLHAIDAGGIELRELEFAGATKLNDITPAANTTNGLLFENARGDRRLEHLVIHRVHVHGFGEAGVQLRAVNPSTTTGGFIDVRVTRSIFSHNGRSGIMTSVTSESGRVADGSLFAFQARAHAEFYVGNNLIESTTGKEENSGSSGSYCIAASGRRRHRIQRRP